MNDTDASFSSATPTDVLNIVETIEKAGLSRAQDRALINNQFNGGRPFTAQEVEEHQIQVNTNFLEGYRVCMDANLQVNNALLGKDRFFNARCLGGKPEKRQEYGTVFTDAIHEVIKDGHGGKRHISVLNDRNASLTLHGIGALVWLNSYDWLPRFVALEDLLIPTDSPRDFTDALGHFAINARFTAGQLVKQTSGPNVDEGWNIPFVRKIIKSIKPLQTYTQDLTDRPEEWESLVKQHGLYMDSDAVPKIKVTYFFHQHRETGKWHRKIVIRKNDAVSESSIEDEFLYDSKEVPFADTIDHIVHVQFGDGNVVAPLKFHSVRGLGMLLYSVVELLNRLRCQFVQHTFEQLMTILRVQNTQDRDRPKVLQLHPYAVLEDGVSIVPQSERSQADPKLVEFAMSQNKQLLGESSSAYVQDVDTGTQREQTLGEAKIKLQSANKIIGGMLSNMYMQEHFYYLEVVRRMLLPDGSQDSVRFKKKCITLGIPEELLSPRFWKIEVEKVFGMGDQTLAIDEANALMAIIDRLDPSGKLTVLRKYISVITRNSDLAKNLVPETEGGSSEGAKAAEDVFGTLMQGVPVALREGIEHEDYVASMMQMMDVIVQRIAQTDNTGTQQDLIGLSTAAADVDQHIQLLAQNASNKPFVAEASKALSKMMNDVRAFQQRQEEAAKAAAKESQVDPAEMAKIQMLQMQSEVKAKTAQEQAALKMQLKQQEHEQKLTQQAQQHAVSLQIEQAKAQANMGIESAIAEAQIANLDEKLAAEIKAIAAKAQADIMSLNMKTCASVAASRVAAESKSEASKPKPDAQTQKPAKEKKERPINIVVNVPKPGRSKVVIERDDKGKIIGAIKEE